MSPATWLQIWVPLLPSFVNLGRWLPFSKIWLSLSACGNSNSTHLIGLSQLNENRYLLCLVHSKYPINVLRIISVVLFKVLQ